MKKLLCVFISIALTCAFTVISTAESAQGNSIQINKQADETLIPCNATIDDNFFPGEILVGIKKAYSEANKVWSSSDFSNLIGISYIEDITYDEQEKALFSETETFNQILKLN